MSKWMFFVLFMVITDCLAIGAASIVNSPEASKLSAFLILLFFVWVAKVIQLLGAALLQGKLQKEEKQNGN